jgi:anti-sigma factor RsiW
MKETNHISDITLNFYQMGLASTEETQMIQKALQSDPEFIARYDELLKTDQKIRELYSWESMPKLAALTKAAAQVQNRSRRGRQGWVYNKRPRRVLITVAAVLLCAIIPTLIYLKGRGSNKDMAIAVAPITQAGDSDSEVEGKVEITPWENNKPIDEELTSYDEPKRRFDSPGSTEMPVVVHEPVKTPETEAVTAMPPPALTEQQSNINIPASITSIVEGMFVNRELSHVIIPDGITLIEKNAFAGNPLISVTIGANVTIDNEAFPGNFAGVYTSLGKAAGTYSRSDVASEIWKKK